MCGIVSAIYSGEPRPQFEEVWEELKLIHKRRGPDYQDEKKILIGSDYILRLYSSVLDVKGDEITRQPVMLPSGDYLQFDGELFGSDEYPESSESGSDIETLGKLLEGAKSADAKDHHMALRTVLSHLKGPWSLVYYHAECRRLFFGRDALGRRSLVIKSVGGDTDEFLLAQVCCVYTEWSEILPGSVYMLDMSGVHEHLLEAARVCSESPIELSSMIEMKNTIQALRYFYPTAFYPRRASSSYPPTPPGDENHINTTKDEIFRLNCALPSPLIIGELRKLATFKHKYESNHYTLPLETLDYFLRRSIRASLHSLKKGDPGAPRVGILFSGGLDCSCICALVHLYLPPGEPIDLINVSFDGKRTPDRKSALESYKELRKVYPSRVWNLIKVDVCEEECIKVQKKMKTLIYPCYESLYMRLAFAFWFASRAHGTLESTGYEYCSRSKVLFSGLGADRIFGGCSRYTEVFTKESWPGIIGEMQYDINDMWNLGRDDRVISDNGKELRLPFLDTALVYAISYIPIYLKTDPGMRRPPGLKLLLRIYCSEILRLPGVAHRTKRDIYVGSGCYRICPDPRYITERSHSVREQESESG